MQRVSDKAEADIFGIRDGQVLSGEVKMSASEFTPEQITRDVKLSSALEADTHVLAAADDIPAEVSGNAEQLSKASNLGLIVLGWIFFHGDEIRTRRGRGTLITAHRSTRSGSANCDLPAQLRYCRASLARSVSFVPLRCS